MYLCICIHMCMYIHNKSIYFYIYMLTYILRKIQVGLCK